MIHGLSERLKDLRLKTGLSQKEVAQQLRVSPSIISSYETGERTPSVENLLALASLYQCSTDYLLGRDSSAPISVLNVSSLMPRQIQLLAELIATMQNNSDEQ